MLSSLNPQDRLADSTISGRRMGVLRSEVSPLTTVVGIAGRKLHKE